VEKTTKYVNKAEIRTSCISNINIEFQLQYVQRVQYFNVTFYTCY
jgi:hypothetical protein